MYGLLLQSASTYLKAKYGQEIFEQVCKEANIPVSGFSTHNQYSETIMTNMGLATAKITGDSLDSIMDSFGVEFVDFVGQFGYDRILKVLGRHMRDFLNGLDNLHEYLRFSYPKLKPPSFFVNDETKNGLTLTYRSKRQGYLHYVKGQIRQVGRVFYKTRVDIFVVANDYNEGTKTTHVKFRLLFDNKAFRDVANQAVDDIVDSIPLRPELLFELFPFHIVFSRKLEVRSLGPGLKAVLPTAVGQTLVDLFTLERPLTSFTWEDILHHTNNVFVLVARPEVQAAAAAAAAAATESAGGDGAAPPGEGHDGTETCPVKKIFAKLQLKGQMMYMNEWDCIMFLGTPIMNSLDDMFRIGLYINDLSMHDSSRDLVLAGTQQSAELKLALDQEQEKSRLLEQSMVKLNKEMQRTDALLYQMIPKPVADRLRRGEPSVETCQVFESVTILFSDVVGFTTICSQITPMEVVSMLNSMYTQFDHLSENHSVYKVETIGDAYMAVSGAPTITRFHALHMCDMALDMRESMSALVNPASNESMKIRIGVHTGTTVAGVVGIKMPRYCLFGDTVNTASRMETSGEAMKIHISETTKRELENFPYEMEERGSIQVKGKGTMKTYWLVGKKDIPEAEMPQCPFLAIMQEEVRSRQAEETGEISQGNNEMGSQAAMHSYSPVSFKDMRIDAPSPLGHGGGGSSSGAVAAAGLLGIDKPGRHHEHPGPRVRSVSMGKCPFSAGVRGAGSKPTAPDSKGGANEVTSAPSLTVGSSRRSSESQINSPSVTMSSTAAPPPAAGTGDAANNGRAKPGLNSLDSGISVSGPPSQHDGREDLTPHADARTVSVGNTRVIIPSIISDHAADLPLPTEPQNLSRSTGFTHPNSQHQKDITRGPHSPDGGIGLIDNVKAAQNSKVHSPQPCCTPTSHSSPKSQHSAAKSSGLSTNNNDDNVIYHAQESEDPEHDGKKFPAGNGTIDMGNYNNSPHQHSNNGTYALKHDAGYVSDAKGVKSSSERKSKLCIVL